MKREKAIHVTCKIKDDATDGYEVALIDLENEIIYLNGSELSEDFVVENVSEEIDQCTWRPGTSENSVIEEIEDFHGIKFEVHERPS